MDDQQSFDVNVNYPGGSVLVKVSPLWNVGRVKEEVAKMTDLSTQNFRIVFAGQALSDNLTLWVSALLTFCLLR